MSGITDSITVQIPYKYQNAPIPGGGYVTGFVFHKKVPEILYARTDIGGVYRYLYDEQRWKSLIDHVSMLDIAEAFPIAVALDKDNPNRLYIGGFVGGDIKDPYFKELLVRWFAWGCFCPVFRMHGERSPWYEREEEFINNVRQLTSGQDNEVWSFGDDNYEILKKYLFIRERLRPYIRECMRQASLTGASIMRPLFFFNGDEMAWETEDEYMFGPDILVAPVMEEKVTQRSVYLPAGAAWTDANTGEVYCGGQRVVVPAPLDIIPVFFRDGKKYDIYQ